MRARLGNSQSVPEVPHGSVRHKQGRHSVQLLLARQLWPLAFDHAAGAPVRIKLRTRMLSKLRYNRPPLQVRLPVEVCIVARHAAKEVRGGVRVRLGSEVE